MKTRFILSMVSLMLVTFSSCKKEDEPHTEDIVINFSSIAEHTMYELGDTIFMNGSVSFNEELHGYSIEILNTSHADSVVFEKHVHDHGTSYNFDEFWINNVNDHSDMLFRLTVFANHESEDVIREVEFHCHPM